MTASAHPDLDRDVVPIRDQPTCPLARKPVHSIVHPSGHSDDDPMHSPYARIGPIGFWDNNDLPP